MDPAQFVYLFTCFSASFPGLAFENEAAETNVILYVNCIWKKVTKNKKNKAAMNTCDQGLGRNPPSFLGRFTQVSSELHKTWEICQVRVWHM